MKVINSNVFIEAVKYYMKNPTVGADIITAAARKASGDSNLILSREERNALKNLAFPVLYGSSRPLREVLNVQ